MSDSRGVREDAPRQRGSEAALSWWSSFFFAAGWVFAVLGVVAGYGFLSASASYRPGAESEAAMMLAAALVCIVLALNAYFFSALLWGAADVVRLLKKSAGVRYSGRL